VPTRTLTSSLGHWSMKVLGRLKRAFAVVTTWNRRHGCHSCRPVRNYKRRRLVHESVCSELKVPDGAEGSFGARPPDCIPNIDNDLYKTSVSSPVLRCVSKTQGKELLLEIHAGIYRGHIGAGALAAKVLRQGFYWPAIIDDATKLVATCEAY
jgi:hypothetical protein